MTLHFICVSAARWASSCVSAHRHARPLLHVDGEGRSVVAEFSQRRWKDAGVLRAMRCQSFTVKRKRADERRKTEVLD